MAERVALLAVLVGSIAYAAPELLGVDLPNAVHTWAGLPLVLFLPGFTLLRLLGIGATDALGTVMLAVGLSVVQTILLGLLLEFVPSLALDPRTWRPALALVVAIQALAALASVGEEPAEVAEEVGPSKLPWLPVVGSIVPLALAGAAVWFSLYSAERADTAAFTQLWALPDPEAGLRLGVRNFEGRAERYLLTVETLDGNVAARYDVDLADGAAWVQEVVLPMDVDPARAEVRLYRQGEGDPYRSVALPAGSSVTLGAGDAATD